MMERENEDNSRTMMLYCPGAVRKERAADIAHYLVVIEGSECGKQLEIGLTPITLGRREDNHFILADPCVSGHHCTIAFGEGRIWVTDLGSTNGTFIDEERIEGRAAWPITATLQVGNQILRQEYHRRGELRRSAELTDELRAAAGYVRSLLPQPLGGGPVATDWYFMPCRDLGGDIFDYFWLDSGHFVFYLLDVCGHGIGAALHSVSVSNLLRQQSLSNVNFIQPAQVLKALNQALPMERYGDMYFTLWYGVYRPLDRRLTFACGGHPPALLFHPQSERPMSLLGADPPIGIISDVDYQETAIMLPENGRIYLYSDGVYEITTKQDDSWNWDEFSVLLEEEVRKGRRQPEAIFQDIVSLTKADRFEDDFSLLALSFDEPA